MTAELRLQILGPLRVWRDGVEADAGPRQQAYLLALLLARAGRPTGTSELIDLIWDADLPSTAVNILQKYIGMVRRVLEPSLPARRTGGYVRRRGDGYQLDADAGVLDLVEFRELVASARVAVPREALGFYARALGLWHGPAGAGPAHGPAAMALFGALEGEFFDACVAASELAVSLGRPGEVLGPLSLAAGMAPLHEPVQAGLMSVLAADGRQAEALTVFRSVRGRLAEDLGVDPGEVLQEAHRRVLRRRLPERRRPGGGAAVLRAPDPSPAGAVPFSRPDAQGPVGARPAVCGPEGAAPGLSGSAAYGRPADEPVGRGQERVVLRQAVASALVGDTGLVVVEGEPGAGKTLLLEEIGAEAGRAGARVLWGRCVEGGGAPRMWPWTQALVTLDQGQIWGLPAFPGPPGARGPAGSTAGASGHMDETPGSTGGAPGSTDAAGEARFLRHERVVTAVAEAAAQRPMVLLLDDLQWADGDSLHLFGHLAARLPPGVALIGAFRDRAPEPGPGLARMLAVTGRLSRHRRLRLGPLGTAATGELARRVTRRSLEPCADRGLHDRTAGNPFLIVELSRVVPGDGVLTADGIARADVPSAVRDLARDRIAGLGEEAVELLRIAAVIGRDVDLTLLARVAGLDVQTCLDRLEPVRALGLLAPSPGDPCTVRFPHELLREAIVRITPARALPRLHLRVAEALDPARAPGHVAYHLRAAGPLAAPAQAPIRELEDVTHCR
ncbi:BTAD domain-containing putative transcriptional regulator [Catenuloplanes japonicus]|uniref:BTAD domain-containing putative transcriptional regulator n=1 Tax=Catenuloplanes japonicus TaxID=33876 RepID=UPI00068FA244|nr:BTAD domain-containing putative transcriptional regulator [Catenuloplanes japonicus]